MNAPPFRPALALLLAPALALAACSGGPPIASHVDDEAVCVDYEVASTHTKMHGGLRQPVFLLIHEGDKHVVTQVFSGLHDSRGSKTTIMLPDANAEYTVEWSQCEKRVGPFPATQVEPKIECDAKVFKTDKLVTKKGDAASHALKFPIAPEAGCWLDESAPPPMPKLPPLQVPLPDASVEPPVAPPASASAAPAKKK
jgi:hypothetical protein